VQPQIIFLIHIYARYVQFLRNIRKYTILEVNEKVATVDFYEKQ